MDGPNCLYRAAYKVSYSMGQKDQPVFGPSTCSSFLGTIRSAADRFIPNKIYIVWDGGRSKRRMEILPTYKNSSRKTLTEDTRRDMWNDISMLSSLLIRLGCRVVVLQDREADDVISFISRGQENPVIASEDMDYLQLIKDGVSVFRPTSEQYVSQLSFYSHYKISPESFLLYRALTGDKSDAIDGIRGIGEVYAKLVLDTEPPPSTLDDLIRRLNNNNGEIPNRISKLILLNIRLVERNLRLIDTAFEILTADEIEIVENSTNVDVHFDESTFADLEKLGMTWIAHHFTSWSAPFRRLV